MLKEEKKRINKDLFFLQKQDEITLNVDDSIDEPERDTEIDQMMILAKKIKK